MYKENCPFLFLPNSTRKSVKGEGNLVLISSPHILDYKISVEAVSWLNQYKKDKNIKNFSQLSQGLINCANKILTTNELKSLPVIVGPIEFKNFKTQLTEHQTNPSIPQLIFNVKELTEEKIDHTLKANALLNQFATKLEDRIAFENFSPTLTDMIKSKICGPKELEQILEYLKDRNLLKESMMSFLSGMNLEPDKDVPFRYVYSITMDGWHQVQAEKEKINTNKVFIATSFGWPKDNEIRLKAIDAIKKACSELGWHADVVSQSHTTYITDRILSEIKSAKFVVAELTYNNNGVYFEAGYARGLGKEVFHVVKDGFNRTDSEADKELKKLHFDIQQIIYRKWNEPEDLAESLYNWINSTFGRYKSS